MADYSLDTPIAAADRSSVVSIAIKDKQALFMAYMPFIKGGGLFVPTKKEYHLGDEIFLLAQIMDEKEKLHIAGKVVWINPAGALQNRHQGIGVQLTGEHAESVRDLIEEKLGATISLTRKTHTM